MTVKPEPHSRRPHRFAGMSKEGRRNARRQVFIEAGIDAICEVGVADLKLRNVCERAGLTERYFYESFTSLQQFAVAVVQHVAFRVSSGLLNEAMQATDGRARLRRVARALVAILDADLRFGRILFVEAERAGGELAQLRHQMLYMATWLMTKWLTENQSTAELLAAATPMLAQQEQGVLPMTVLVSGDIDSIAIAGASAEILIAWVEGRIDKSADEVSDYIIRYIDNTMEWQQQD